MFRTWLVPLVAALVGVALIVPALSTPANADAVSQPFAGVEYLGKCSKPGLQKSKTVSRAPRESDTNGWKYVGKTTSATGNYYSQIRVKNSYRDQLIQVYCNGYNHKRTRSTNPVHYVHKTQYTTFQCGGLSCRPVAKKTHGWTSGYCTQGTDKKPLCSFKE